MRIVTYPYPTADLNFDCYVDLSDLCLFSQHWLESPCIAADACGHADLLDDAVEKMFGRVAVPGRSGPDEQRVRGGDVRAPSRQGNRLRLAVDVHADLPPVVYAGQHHALVWDNLLEGSGELQRLVMDREGPAVESHAQRPAGRLF